MFAIHLQKKGYQLDDTLGMSWLSQKSKGYSGREIARLCKEAIKKMIEEENRDIIGFVDQGNEKLKNYSIHVRPLKKKDFEYAFTNIKPETSDEAIKGYENWAKRYGG